MRRFWNGRGMRKLRRNRLAMFCLGVIGFYLLIAAASFVGILSEEDTWDRAGPAHMPGFFAMPSEERRIDAAEFYLRHVERAMRRKSDESMRRAGRLFERELQPVDRQELQARIDRSWDQLEKADETLYAWQEAPEGGRAALYAELRTQLQELDAGVAGLFVEPRGLAAFSHSLRMLCGTDRQGRSILYRGLYSVRVAIQIGIIVALISVIFGTLLGAAAAFFGGWVDHVVIWLYSTFSAVPNLVLLSVLVFMFMGGPFDGTLIPVYASLCLTYWIGPCRVIRGETLKIKELEYVQAATTIGFSRFYILRKHVIPNTVHLMFINFSLLFIGAIKAEVILTFLGLGVQSGASWGIMIDHSKQEVIGGFFWQIGTATALMFGLVLAFNVLTDALQDAFDPKHVG
jgi:peptide/nickel transport system permease protein